MNEEKNLIEIIKTPGPENLPTEESEGEWAPAPVVPLDGALEEDTPDDPPGAEVASDTIRYHISSSAVSLALGAPSAWKTLATLPFINTKDQQVVKLDVSFNLSWTTAAAAYSEIGVDYRILRDGSQVYLATNAFSYQEKASTKNSEQLSFFHVDAPAVGNHNYTLQVRINHHTNIQDGPQITYSDLAAVIYTGIQSKSYLYVSYIENIEAPNDPGFVAVVDPESRSVIKTIQVGHNPGPLAKSPDGASVYVVNVQDKTVSIINTATLTVAATLPVGDEPAAVMVAPDNTKAYVANYGSKNVTIIDNKTRQVHATVPVTGSPFAFAAQPNSWFIFTATITEGSTGNVVAISVGTDHVQNLGGVSGLDRRYNPLAPKVVGNKLVVIVPDGLRSYTISNPSTISYSYKYGVKDWISGVFLNRWDYVYGIKTWSTATRGRFKLYDSGSYAGPWSYASFTGQSHIIMSPDYSRICISIEANGDQYAGLQIIDTDRDNELHILELPVAHKSVITSDSSLAFVLENSYVHPVDIINFTNPFESIHIGDKVNDMVAAYQMTT